MALQLYTLANIFVDGALLAEEITVGVDRDSRAQEVVTVAKGFAGFSPGAPVVMISIDNAVPAFDFELNFGGRIKALQVCEVTVFAAGRTLTTKGMFLSDSFSHSANADSKLSAKFQGEFADWT